MIFNWFILDHNGFNSIITKVRTTDVPTIYLGAGGEHVTNAAKTFATCTAAVLGLPKDLILEKIPEKDSFFEEYSRHGDTGTFLEVQPSNMENETKENTLKNLVERTCLAMDGPAIESDEEADEFE